MSAATKSEGFLKPTQSNLAESFQSLGVPLQVGPPTRLGGATKTVPNGFGTALRWRAVARCLFRG
jgi:hypothetical protein